MYRRPAPVICSDDSRRCCLGSSTGDTQFGNWPPRRRPPVTKDLLAEVVLPGLVEGGPPTAQSPLVLRQPNSFRQTPPRGPGSRTRRATLLLLPIGFCQLLAEQEGARSSEVRPLVGQMGCRDHEDPSFGPRQGAEGSARLGHVLPDRCRMLLGDKPRGGLNFEIQANLGNQAPHPVGVVPLVRSEVSVVFTGVPEDSLQTAPVALSGQVVRGFADELGNLGQRLRWVCGEPAGDQSGAWAPLCVNFKTARLSCDWSAVRRWATKLSSGPKLPSSSIGPSGSHERED